MVKLIGPSKTDYVRGNHISSEKITLLRVIPTMTHDIYTFFLLANLLAFYQTYLLAFYLAYLLALYLAYLLAFYLAYLLALYLAYLMAFYLAYLLAFYLAVEVQRCALSWDGPRLRSSGAH